MNTRSLELLAHLAQAGMEKKAAEDKRYKSPERVAGGILGGMAGAGVGAVGGSAGLPLLLTGIANIAPRRWHAPMYASLKKIFPTWKRVMGTGAALGAAGGGYLGATGGVELGDYIRKWREERGK